MAPIPRHSLPFSFASGSSIMSYQNGGPRSLKIEEIGVSPETLHRRKTNRRLLFTGIGLGLALTFCALAVMVHNHQQQAHQQETMNDDVSGADTGHIERTYDDETISLDYLNSHTNSSIPSGCETTIILMRHCEKIGAETVDEDGNEHCTYQGYERAHFLPSLFGVDGGRWPVPVALMAFAVQRSDHLNFREVETLVPLANKYGLLIESDFPDNKSMSKRLFKGIAEGDWCGRAVVVSWRHSYLGGLAQQLGCIDCPDDYPDHMFDEVWQLKYVYGVNGTPVIQTSHKHPEIPTPPLSHSSAENSNVRRELKKKRGIMSDKKWSVYSTITRQNFDPLKHSFQVGDYDGSQTGGKWFSSESEGEM